MVKKIVVSIIYILIMINNSYGINIEDENIFDNTIKKYNPCFNSPENTFKTYIYSLTNYDLPTYKKCFSKKNQENIKIDESSNKKISKELNDIFISYLIEKYKIKDEKIIKYNSICLKNIMSGIQEIKASETIEFIKENNEWKIKEIDSKVLSRRILKKKK
jgi:hypothetical protein